MRKRSPQALALAVLIPLLGSCNDNNFSSSGSGAAKEEAAGDSCTEGDCGPTEPTVPTNECVDGDNVNIQWSGDVKECLDQGKTYNFEAKKCAAMRQSQFACEWPTLKEELSKRSILSDKLSSGADNGAKLVSCGQSEDGNRIVVQWIKAEDVTGIDCKDGNSSHHITTGCYTVYTSESERPPEPANEQERAKQVYDCMNRL